MATPSNKAPAHGKNGRQSCVNVSRVPSPSQNRAGVLKFADVSNVGAMADCCELLGGINPYEHELGIYRDDVRVWSGPVVDISFPSETVIIDCEDLSSWLKVREIHYNHNDVQHDLATIWQVMNDLETADEVDEHLVPSPEVRAFVERRWNANHPQQLRAFAMHLLGQPSLTERLRARLDGVLTQN